MNIDNKLDILKQIQQVDAPPFLLTRILGKIDNLSSVEAPVKWKWAFAVSGILVLALNVSVFFKAAGIDTASTADKNAGIENIANSMNLIIPNNLYNE